MELFINLIKKQKKDFANNAPIKRQRRNFNVIMTRIENSDTNLAVTDTTIKDQDDSSRRRIKAYESTNL